ncbi:hypothetical protein ISS05_00950 [Candidatus Woesearchaeota archaeon]|nr:hypothetical protein [Candidatus Woesearchaeota archaeon]
MAKDNIKIISIEFKKIKINKFLPKEKTVEFSIFFNDSDDKEISRSINLGNIEGIAENIVDDIVNMEKNINKEFDGEALIDNPSNVFVKNKEELLPKITNFLKKVSENIEQVKACKTSNGYLDLVGKVNRMSLEF